MEKERDYLSILIESLKKKKVILNEIISLNKIQLESVSGKTIDDDKFNETIEKKEVCINEIEKLDKGFESVYNHIKDSLLNNSSLYENEISILKKLISEITESSMEVQLSEKRNEQIVLKKMSDERRKIHQSKTANKVANDYYQNMNKVNYIDPQFLDKKK